MSSVVKKKLKIEGMHCTSCAINIDFDLEDLEGVTSVKTSYARQECEIEYEQEKVTEQIIVKTIQKTGYKAQLQEER